MNIKKLTQIFIYITLTIVIVYDIYAIAKGGTEASISSFIIIASYKMPLLPFSVGVLCGHLFWRMRANKDTIKELDNVIR